MLTVKEPRAVIHKVFYPSFFVVYTNLFQYHIYNIQICFNIISTIKHVVNLKCIYWKGSIICNILLVSGCFPCSNHIRRPDGQSEALSSIHRYVSYMITSFTSLLCSVLYFLVFKTQLMLNWFCYETISTFEHFFVTWTYTCM